MPALTWTYRSLDRLLAVAGSFWLVAGCSDPGSEPECGATTDCDDGLVCVAGTCPTADPQDAGPDADQDQDRGDDAGPTADSDPEESDCSESIDVVFVIDVSTSMSVLLRALESQIGMVWRSAQQHDSEPRFGLVVFVDDVLLVNDGQAYETPESLRDDLRSWYAHTSTNRQTTSDSLNTDWPENSLDALVAAATGFQWRDADRTLRVVIHATDDTFIEHPYSFSSGIQAQSTYAQTVEALQERSIRVASFAARQGGAYGDVDVGAGFFSEYGGQAPIPEATSGNVFDIHQVGDSVALSDSIVDFVRDELCEEYVLE